MAAAGLAGAVEPLATAEGTGAVTVAVEGGGGGFEVGLPICW